MVLKLTGVSKRFEHQGHSVTAVDQVSLSISSGELASIVGPSGSGKSTLFHLMTGMLRPSEGEIWIDGFPVHSAGGRELSALRNQTIGYILQEKNLLLNFSVLENVCMPLVQGRNIKPEGTAGEVRSILEELGIWHLRNAYPHELSGGEARRAAIARALVSHASLIIADEPTSNLDPENSVMILKLFQRIRDKGVAVLVSTHDIMFPNDSDRVFSMKHGRLEEVVHVVS
ncbi:MAG: transporter related protein [Oscillospiraceae bacterium]|nr:transporter related protein [Oscillospiraceae bacterium]